MASRLAAALCFISVLDGFILSFFYIFFDYGSFPSMVYPLVRTLAEYVGILSFPSRFLWALRSFLFNLDMKSAYFFVCSPASLLSSFLAPKSLVKSFPGGLAYRSRSSISLELSSPSPYKNINFSILLTVFVTTAFSAARVNSASVNSDFHLSSCIIFSPSVARFFPPFLSPDFTISST